jgi:CheY-like chemotaxis protein
LRIASVKKWVAALVVEDDALVRFDLAQTLEAEGYKTFEAADAAEAIAILETKPEIRVVFTDIQIPGTMDGLELARYVRLRWPPTIIVVCSGRCSPTKGEMASGALFVAKPYVPEVLTKVLYDIRQQLL